MLVAAKGTTPAQRLFTAAQGCCGGVQPPTLVWAPDGSQLLIGTLIDKEQVPVHAFTPDGREITPPGDLSELVGVAVWQPVPRS
jgi:hypothetical protein